ncbi:MAG: POTRA domain-containing protein [Bdellovibrionota bacterium]
MQRLLVTLWLANLILFLSFHTKSRGLDVLKDPLEFYALNSNDKLLTQYQAQNKIIQSIRVDGNTRTSIDIIANKIMLKEGASFSKDLFDETLQNLKNLQVFSKITIFIYENKEKKLDLKIEIVEKWTMIPYFVVGSGGGTAYYAFGLYDTNFLGRMYTFNFTYGCKNYNCSTASFFRNPSLLGQKINFVITPALYHNVYYLYDRRRDNIGAFANIQTLLISYADFEINKGLSIGGGVVYQKNDITAKGLKSSDLENNERRHFNSPNSTTSTAFEGRLTLGQIDYDGIVVNGVNYVSVIDSTLQANINPENNYTASNNTVLFYHVLPFFRDSYFAFRGNGSVTSSQAISQYYYLGGLDKIRGFYDGEFAGKYAWFTNSEFRIPSYIGNTIALQHVLFSDSGAAANSFAGAFTSHTAVNVGTGIRILFLEINKIALRADFAYTLSPFQTYGVSLGLLQFF